MVSIPTLGYNHSTANFVPHNPTENNHQAETVDIVFDAGLLKTNNDSETLKGVHPNLL
jgi:hypothetical protein